MVRNEYVRFGGHFEMQVIYKILQLAVSMKAPILHNLPCFQEAALGSMQAHVFRGYRSYQERGDFENSLLVIPQYPNSLTNITTLRSLVIGNKI
jgi:hypothetical protein